MALFTGKGDGGTTTVFDSKERISKSSALPECLGTLDELNSFIGLARVRARDGADPEINTGGADKRTSEILRAVQENLFIVQAETAGADKRLERAKTEEAEAIIRAIEKTIPPITAFSVAGGTELSALLDVVRTLVRRTERRMSAVEGAELRTFSDGTKAYMNRLSTLLFALARLANFAEGVKEENPSYT